MYIHVRTGFPIILAHLAVKFLSLKGKGYGTVCACIRLYYNMFSISHTFFLHRTNPVATKVSAASATKTHKGMDSARSRIPAKSAGAAAVREAALTRELAVLASGRQCLASETEHRRAPSSRGGSSSQSQSTTSNKRLGKKSNVLFPSNTLKGNIGQ